MENSRSYEKYAATVRRPRSSPKVNPDLTIACILDDRYIQALQFECNLLRLREDNWRVMLSATHPDMVLIQLGQERGTVQRGADSLGFIQELTGWCRYFHIPAVLWDQEEEIPFIERMKVAKYFEHVLTTPELAAGYQAQGEQRVYVAFPVFQPRMFQPVLKAEEAESALNRGIEEFFAANPRLNNLVDGIRNSIPGSDLQYAEKVGLRKQREVLGSYTYTHLIDALLERVGLSEKKHIVPGVSVITATMRPQALETILQNYTLQLYPRKELIIILNNNSIDLLTWQRRVSEIPNVRIMQVEESQPLGFCLNQGIKNSRYEYFSKFDDDNYYGANFLTDLMNAFLYTDVDMVGKLSFYCYLEGSQTLAILSPRMENRYVNFLSGSGLIVKKAVWRDVPFTGKPRGCDTLFLRGCVEKGFTMYSADHFNYVYHRHASQAEHTWQISDEVFLRSCETLGKVEDYWPVVVV